MSSVMAREEPLIKQLARSRALVGGGSRPSRYAHNVNFKLREPTTAALIIIKNISIKNQNIIGCRKWTNIIPCSEYNVHALWFIRATVK